MAKLDFLVNRLLRMSLPELLYRLGQKAQNAYEKWRLDRFHFNTEVIDYNRTFFSKKLEFVKPGEIIEKAGRIVNNRFDILALKNFYIGEDIDYHRDYKHNMVAPRDLFGKSIDYRDSGKIGDIKYIWELNRHIFLLPLALAYDITKDKKYIEKLKYFLNRWIEQNPLMKGVNWASSLELGIRLINWTFCWHILNNYLDEEFKAKWLDSVYKHCWFINRNLSAFSSANNHLMGEAAGLFVASTAMPQFKESRKWSEKTYGILLRESRKQNYVDGVNKEQAVSYQQFVLDFLLISGFAGEANNIKFPPGYWFIVENMLVYLASIEDFNSNVPHYGDEDDGYVVDLMQREYGTFSSLLNTGAYLFKKSKFLKANRELDQKTLILLNIGNINIVEVTKSEDSLPVYFNCGGYYLLGTDFNRADEQKLIFDCGALGYLSIAAHAHADALSFYFSAGGCPIFIDPGTYAYHADKKWRSYFRSTAAHNTARIDGKDQSVMVGNFMWSRKAKAHISRYENLTKVKGYHDGYKKLKDGVIHEREINYTGESNLWEIKDDFTCKEKHLAELFFHLHPDCRVEKREEEFIIHFAKGHCRMKFEYGLDIQVFKGDEGLPLGWYSPSYDVKFPAETIRVVKQINGPTAIVTKLTIVFDRDKLSIDEGVKL